MNVLHHLFGSRARTEILSLLILHPGERFYLREIQRRTGQDVNPVKKELDRLQKSGLITSVMDGNRRYVSINPNCGIFPEVKGLILKTVALGDVLRASFSNLKGIQFAFIYGSFAGGQETAKSDIDLFVIGEISGMELQKAIGASKAASGREINVSNFSLQEFLKRARSKDHFVGNVMRRKKIFLIGNNDELGKIVGRGQA